MLEQGVLPEALCDGVCHLPAPCEDAKETLSLWMRVPQLPGTVSN